jgi:hypothetical protein
MVLHYSARGEQSLGQRLGANLCDQQLDFLHRLVIGELEGVRIEWELASAVEVLFIIF